jgi:hypothetical protein
MREVTHHNHSRVCPTHWTFFPVYHLERQTCTFLLSWHFIHVLDLWAGFCDGKKGQIHRDYLAGGLYGITSLFMMRMLGRKNLTGGSRKKGSLDSRRDLHSFTLACVVLSFLSICPTFPWFFNLL